MYKLFSLIFFILSHAHVAFADLHAFAESFLERAHHIEAKIYSFPFKENSFNETLKFYQTYQVAFKAENNSVEHILFNYFENHPSKQTKTFENLKSAASIFYRLKSTDKDKILLVDLALRLYVPKNLLTQLSVNGFITEADRLKLFETLFNHPTHFKNESLKTVNPHLNKLSEFAPSTYEMNHALILTAFNFDLYNKQLLVRAAESLNFSQPNSDTANLAARYLQGYFGFSNNQRMDLPRDALLLIQKNPRNSWIYNGVPIYKDVLLNVDINPEEYKNKRKSVADQLVELNDIFRKYDANPYLIHQLLKSVPDYDNQKQKQIKLDPRIVERLKKLLLGRPDVMFQLSSENSFENKYPLRRLGVHLYKLDSNKKSIQSLRAEFDSLMAAKEYSLAMLLMLHGAYIANEHSENKIRQSLFYREFQDVIENWILIVPENKSTAEKAKKAVALFTVSHLLTGSSDVINEILRLRSIGSELIKSYTVRTAQNIQNSARNTGNSINKMYMNAITSPNTFGLISTFSCKEFFRKHRYR